MKKLKLNEHGSYIHPCIKVMEIKNLKNKYNLGVVALEDINSGITIERSPYLEIDPINNALAEPLNNYVFQSHLNENKYLVVFGYGSMYNHSKNNNVDYYLDNQDRFFKYVTNKKIKKGDELFINYGDYHSVNTSQ